MTLVVYKIDEEINVFYYEECFGEKSCLSPQIVRSFVTNSRQHFKKVYSGRSRISQTGGGGANPQDGATKLLFGQFFLGNCMKMKEIGPGGGMGASLAPLLDPARYPARGCFDLGNLARPPA